MKGKNYVLMFSRVRVRRIFPPGLTFSLRIRACQVARESLIVCATRMTGEAAARGGYSCIGEVTVSGNRVRAGASGTRRRSVTRPTDPLKRLELSPSRLLRARCSFLCHRRRRRRRRRPSSSVQVPAHRESRSVSSRDSRAGNGPALRQRDYAVTRARSWTRRGLESAYDVDLRIQIAKREMPLSFFFTKISSLKMLNMIYRHMYFSSKWLEKFGSSFFMKI